jgi:hypothetical protein
MRMGRLLFAAVVLSCLVTSARAAEAAPAAATDLARLLVTKEMWAQGVQAVAQNVQSQFQGHPGAKLKIPVEKARAEVEAALPYDELVQMHAKALAKNYSASELTELLAFHRTPTGKHWLTAQPAVFETVGAETQQRIEKKMPEIMQKLAQGAGAPGSEKPAAKKK